MFYVPASFFFFFLFWKLACEYNWRNNVEVNTCFIYIQDSYVRLVRATESEISRCSQQIELQIVTVEFSVDLGSG